MSALAASERPNLLFILADEWRAQATDYHGDTNARTPVMDRLASESLNFQNAVSGTPVCCPYRASLLTGQYPLTHGVFLNGAGTPQTLTKYMGDVNNGTFPVNLTFPKVNVGPTDTVVMNYLIVNTGHKNPSQTVATLEAAGTQLATKGGTLLGAAFGSAIPGLGTALGALAGWLAGELVGLLNANCDGPVCRRTGCLHLQRPGCQNRAG